MLCKFGRITQNIKPCVLWCFYRETGLQSAASDLTEDKKVKQLFDMEPEDATTIENLAAVTDKEHRTNFYVFWAECAKFLREDVGVAVDDRRHDSITHLAKAISIRDLHEQVAARCPTGTPIPSQEWVRLQRSHAAIHYTGRLLSKKRVWTALYSWIQSSVMSSQAHRQTYSSWSCCSRIWNRWTMGGRKNCRTR